MIKIKKLAQNFSARYPDFTLSKILLLEPDELEDEVFLAKVQTWIAILDSEKLEVKGKL